MDNNFFVGIDPSYASTGLIILDKDAEIIEQRTFSVIPKDNKIKGNLVDNVEESLSNYEKIIAFIPEIAGLNRLYIEAPAYSSDGNRVMQMGTLHYFICFLLFKKKVNYKRIAPGTLKKFITGNGRAKKDLILF